MPNPRLLACLALLILAACGGGTAEKPPYQGIKLGKPYEIYGRWYEPHYNAHYDEIGMASWYGPGFHGGHTASGERFDQDAMTAAHKTLPLPSIVRVTNLSNGLSAIIKVNDRGPFSRERIIDLSRGAAKKLGVIRTGTAKVRVQFLEQETREYVENMQNGTQYAMREMNKVDPGAAGEREEEGTRPTLKIEPRMFADAGASSAAPQPPTVIPSVFSVVDNNTAPPLPPRVTPASYHPPVPAPEPQALVPPANTGFFIQVGTFAFEENAFNMVDRISEDDGPDVMEVSIGGKKFYRVMVGPYESHSSAKNMLSKLASLGISNAKIVHN